MDLVKFWTLCSTNNIILTKDQLDLLERYGRELKYWNSQVNLISRKDEDNIFDRHIMHCLAILKYIDIPAKSRVIDIGTGGGLPGIPIKIANPEIDMLMVDSVNKKIKLTKMFAQHTNLRNIEALWARVETLSENPIYRRNFDFVVSRAVARIELIVEWTHLLVKKNTKFLLLKGGDLTEEIKSAKDKYPELKIKEINIDILGLPYFLEENKKLLICSFD